MVVCMCVVRMLSIFSILRQDIRVLTIHRDQPFTSPRPTAPILPSLTRAWGLLGSLHKCLDTSEAPAAGPNAQYQVNLFVDTQIEI